MGDFNAEPEEVAIQYLLEQDNFNPAVSDCLPSTAEATDSSVTTTTTCNNNQASTPFVDAWQHVQQSKRMPSVGSAESVDSVRSPTTSSGEAPPQAEEKEVKSEAGLTFPACNPVKRIDFIMVRNATASAAEPHSKYTQQVHVEIRDFQIEGVKPTADTGK